MHAKKITVLNFNYDNYRLYLFSVLFALGNVLLPIMCHTSNFAGNIFLPIYFFTLIGAYKFGWKTGVFVAILSPLFNLWITGMPTIAMIPVVLAKGLLIVLGAFVIAHFTKKFSLAHLIVLVASYQLCGAIFEALWFMSISSALSSLIIAWPGMVLQVILGYAVIEGIKDYA